MLRANVLKLIGALRGPPLAYWLVVGLPVFLSVLILVSLGPSLQSSIFSAAAAEGPNIYDAQFKGSIARQPGVGDAILAAIFNLHFIAISLAAALISTIRRTIGSMFGWMAIAIFGAWSVGDIFITPNILENIVANAVGGLCVASIMTGSICIARAVTKSYLDTHPARNVVFSTALVAIPFAFFLATLWGLKLYYDAPPAQVELSSLPKLDGFFFKETKESIKGEDFDFLPDRTSSTLTIQSSEGEPFFSATAQPDALDRTVRISLHVNCFGKQLTDEQFRQGSIPTGSIRQLSSSMNTGPSIIRMSSANGNARYSADWGTFYWVDTLTDKAKISFFTSPKDRISIRTSDRVVLDASLSLHTVSGNKFVRSSRSVSLARDGRAQTIEFVPNPEGQHGTQLRCRPWTLDRDTARRLAEGESITVHVGNAALAGVQIALENQQDEEARAGVSLIPDVFAFGNFLGSTSFEDLPLRDLQGGDARKIGGLSISAEQTRLLVNGKPVDISPTDRVTLMGDFMARYQRDGSIGVEGTAQAAWKNDTRLNETRWERLPAEWRLPIIGFLLTVLSAIIAFTWTRVRGKLSENPRDWV